ncbi:putative RNA-directed DNA polymerase from transposon BS [Colletotrichum higginsianum]|uniref:Putative RNA-directed DNA polymerase from transposon BS n=1 Tax=Colletotrichum higginsianum TaxID=80884 RepID=A0A4T0VTT1_9PEZI|nr:putative RNA-directed DNA polymerase from transposon BS [Colletotrichum higginsianum]
MAVSLDAGPSITVHGDASTSRRSGRVRKPTAKVRVVEQVSYQDNAELKDEINKLSNLVQDLLRRDAEREQFLKDCLMKIESLEKELQEEKQRSDRHQRGLARSMHAVSTGPSESAQSLQGHPLHTAQNQPPQVRSYAMVASQPLTRQLHETTPAKQAANRAASKDLRIFARLPPESPLRNKRAYDIYAFVREKLSPQAREALKGIDHVKTGLALLPSSADGAKVLLENREQIAALLQAQAVEQRDTWIRAYIANVPYTRHCLLTNTELEITTEELLEEIQATTKLKPEKAYFSRKDEAERLGTVTAWFKAEAVRQLPRRLRLMGASVFVNLQFPKEKRSPQCHRCGGFHNERTRMRPSRVLQIMQANVARRPLAHETALNLAYAAHVDILLLQEPAIRSEERRLTRCHPGFEIFTPVDNWIEDRPRVLTYLRRGTGLRGVQTRPLPSPSTDLLFLQLLAGKRKVLTVINVYNAPCGSLRPGQAIRDIITAWQPGHQERVLVAGDFNLRHWTWQPEATSSSDADDLVEWTETVGLVLLSPIGEATHKDGNTLDLCWASGSLHGASTSIETSLHTTSDHESLLTRVPLALTDPVDPTPGRFRLDTMDEKLFLDILQRSIHPVRHTASNARDPQALDMLAQQLTDCLVEALTASTRRALGRGPGRPYWDENCRRKHRAYTTKRATVARLCALGIDCQWERNEEDALKQDFLHQLRRSKDTYWRGKIAAASTGKDVFEMVGWQKAKGSFQTPPLRDGSNPTALISQPKEKRDLFARVLLRNAAISTDIPAESPGPRLEANLPFPRVTKDEVQTSIFSARSTTPGSDGITTAVLKTAWPVIEDIVFRLYSGCVCEGWHPTCFKEAILVILPKPGKRDRALPRSYRPIALLSVLGKGLERLVARRLAWITVKFQVLHDQQFGALPLRSCSDLIAAAIHDIECAWQRGRVTSMLTLDIKGAFDAVLPGRLIRRLRCQGWPENLVRWVSSFVLGRRARIRLDGEMGDVFDLECGLPQGSPVSPILFMLHIEPLFKLGTVHPGRKRSRFGYADDIAIMASSTSLEDNCALLAKEWEEAQEWGALEGITFDTDKSELIHFTKRPKDRNPPITVRLLDGRQHTVQAVNQGASLRWLGVHFDRRLTFKNHVKGHCAKACQVVNGLRGLGNTAWGAPTHLLRRAITSCVLPIQYYASEAWWPGRNRIKNGHIASNGVNGLLNQLDITQAKAIRAALPVYRTTPVSILQREAALPPAEVMLDAKLHKASVRIHRLDDRHPLRTRLGERPGPDSRLRRMASLIERHAEYIDPLELPPWERSADWHTALSMVGYEPRKTKDELATAFTDRLGALSKRDIVVYTDGSQMVDGSRTAAGAGWVGYQATRQIFRGSEPLGHQTEVFDAEAQAAFRGLLEAMRSPTARMADNVHICLDNLAVTARLVTRSPGSSQARFRAFRYTFGGALDTRE